MAIDLDNLYQDLGKHAHHKISIAAICDMKGKRKAILLECETCGVVLLRVEKGDEDVLL